MEGSTGAPVKLREMVVEQHTLDVSIRLTFLSASRRELNESVKQAIADELDEHLAAALARRNLIVLQLHENTVEIA